MELNTTSKNLNTYSRFVYHLTCVTNCGQISWHKEHLRNSSQTSSMPATWSTQCNCSLWLSGWNLSRSQLVVCPTSVSWGLEWLSTHHCLRINPIQGVRASNPPHGGTWTEGPLEGKKLEVDREPLMTHLLTFQLWFSPMTHNRASVCFSSCYEKHLRPVWRALFKPSNRNEILWLFAIATREKNKKVRTLKETVDHPLFPDFLTKGCPLVPWKTEVYD